MEGQEGVDRLEELVGRFLGKQRIAIWGMDETKGDQFVANKFRKRGVEVIEVNPLFVNASNPRRTSSLTNIDPPVDAVFVFVDKEQALEAVYDCVEAKIPLVWLHDARGPGAATTEAIDRLRSTGSVIIPGLCPMFFLKPLDPAHFCLKWVVRLSGKEKRIRSHTC